MPLSSRVFAPIVALVLTVSLLLPAPSAKADTMDGFYPSMVLYLGGGLGVLSGLPGLIGNSVYLADGERSPLGWQIVGYVGGGLSVAGGVGGLVADTGSDLLVGLGVTLLALGADTYRFGALRRRIGGVSERMLAQTLKQLAADGLVERIAHDTVPPHVEYRATPMGAEATEKLRDLADWIEGNLPRIMAHQAEVAED